MFLIPRLWPRPACTAIFLANTPWNVCVGASSHKLSPGMCKIASKKLFARCRACDKILSEYWQRPTMHGVLAHAKTHCRNSARSLFCACARSPGKMAALERRGKGGTSASIKATLDSIIQLLCFFETGISALDFLEVGAVGRANLLPNV